MTQLWMEPNPEEQRRELLARRASLRSEHSPSETAKRRVVDRFSKINWFVDTQMAALTGSERSAWIVLWREERGGVVEVSHSEIAARSGMTRRNAIRVVNRLIELGLVRLVKRGSAKESTTNRYALLVPE